MREILADAVRLRCDDALRWMERFVRSENGVLTVEFAKREEAKPRQITINVQ